MVLSGNGQNLLVNVLCLAIILQVQQGFSLAQTDIDVVGLQALGAVDCPQCCLKLLFLSQYSRQQPPASAWSWRTGHRSLNRGPNQQVLSFITPLQLDECACT